MKPWPSAWGSQISQLFSKWGSNLQLLDVMYADAPYTVTQRAVHIHPTVTELIPTMLGELKPLE